MQPIPSGYKFLRIVLILGAVGFGLLGIFYVLAGQMVPGLFALFVAAIEAAGIPLLRKFAETAQPHREDGEPPDNGSKQ